MPLITREDLRISIRRLRKYPGATLASVLALACGIGAAAAAWSLLSAVLLTPLPVEEPERLFLVEGGVKSPTFGMRFMPVHLYPDYMSIRDSGAFDAVAAGGAWPLLVTEGGARPQARTVYFASHDFFATLGIRMELGRGFTRDDDRRGAAAVAVLSDRYWRSVFTADPRVIGTTVLVAKTPVTVVGVAARGFRGLNLAEAPDLYLALHTVGEVADGRGTNFFAEPMGSPPVRSSPTAWIRIVGRTRPDESAAIATARLGSAALPRRWSESVRLTGINTAAIPEAAREGMARFTTLLATTVGLLLLVGCVTVGMLLLVRTEDRRGEFAVCLALGASRLTVARAVALDGAILSALGAALAIPVAWWLFSGIRAFQLPGRVDLEMLELSLDHGAWLTAAGAAMTATSLLAMMAAVFGMSANASEALRSRAGATPRVTRRRMRVSLVAAQVAITLVLVTGAGLFARSLMAALSLNPGIETNRIVTGTVSLGPYGYTPPRAVTFFTDLRARLDASRAIESAAMIQPEGSMGPGGRVTIDGVPREMPSPLIYTAVDERYFSTIGLPLVSGRSFAASDTAGAPLVVLVSESLGRLIAGEGSPLGHRITETRSRPPAPPAVAEIIGVVPDVISNVNTTAPLVKYYALAQREPTASRTIVVRAAGEPAPAVRDTIAVARQLDPQVTPTAMLTLDEQIGRQMNPQRFGIYVLGALGGIALLLTVLGTYVVAASMASARKREMSIRASLGASGAALGGLVLRETGRLIGAGLVAGIVLAWLGASTIRALLYRIEPLDPLTLATTCAVILGLGLIVSLRPALDAARVDFTRMLHEE